MFTTLILLSLSLVSLASAAGSDGEIIARQAQKIQSLEDEIKELKAVNQRRRLMSDDFSDSDYSDDGFSDFAGEWKDFVNDMCNLKDGKNEVEGRRGGEEELLEVEEGEKRPPAPPPPGAGMGSGSSAGTLMTTVSTCSDLSMDTIARVPAFKRFIGALKDNVKYSSVENIKCMICSLKNMYKTHMSDACGDSVLLPVGSGRIEKTTFNPLVVMAPSLWLNNSHCLDLINPTDKDCEDTAFVGDQCVMKLPTFKDLQHTASEEGNSNEAANKDFVYTAEAAMEYFELGLPAHSFNFILSRFLEQSDNPVVYERDEWDKVRARFELEPHSQTFVSRRRLRMRSPNGMS